MDGRSFREGVLLRVAAAVVGLVVVPLTLHAPIAHAAPQPVGDSRNCQVASAVPLPGLAFCTFGGEDLLGPLERVGVDERHMDGIGRPDPGIGRIPAHPRLVAERDIVDVDEDLVLALRPFGVHLLAEISLSRVFSVARSGLGVGRYSFDAGPAFPASFLQDRQQPLGAR